MVAGRPADDVAVSKSRSASADHDTATLSRRPRHVGRSRDREARVTAHAAAQLRHPSEQGVDIRLIQVALGHSKLDTTAHYAHVASKALRDMESPLDRLTPLRPRKGTPK